MATQAIHVSNHKSLRAPADNAAPSRHVTDSAAKTSEVANVAKVRFDVKPLTLRSRVTSTISRHPVLSYLVYLVLLAVATLVVVFGFNHDFLKSKTFIIGAPVAGLGPLALLGFYKLGHYLYKRYSNTDVKDLPENFNVYNEKLDINPKGARFEQYKQMEEQRKASATKKQK